MLLSPGAHTDSRDGRASGRATAEAALQVAGAELSDVRAAQFALPAETPA
jgi:hypothetical protein